MTVAAERFGIAVRRLMAATDGGRLHWRPVLGHTLDAAGPRDRMVNVAELAAFMQPTEQPGQTSVQPDSSLGNIAQAEQNSKTKDFQ
jgi:hypothetical protein